MAQWLAEVSVGEWFEAGHEPFEIVGIDPEAELVLVQHFDGSLEDIDFDSWVEMAARPCAAPEDYSGALDLDREDLQGLMGLPPDGELLHGLDPLLQLERAER
ncbi:MAG TPA: DUF6763 family protein [Nevskiaceae bacterium]|nr:DUF6763 family protein [Nevskiaceae bacterium]